MSTQRRGFTLLELLISVSIIAVILTAVTLVSDPRERLKEVRDNRRLRDIATLNKALGIMQAQMGTASLGSTSTTYLSIGDASSTCGTLGITQDGSYACSSTSSLRNIDASGWAPVNFMNVTGGSPLSVLPTDPVNATSSGLFYTLMVGANGTWKLSAGMESSRYIGQAAIDGGVDPLRFETGSDLTLYGGGLPIGTPRLWLAASAITGLSDGQNVNTWDDLSGNNFDATGVGSGANRPHYLTNSINGEPAIRFTTASSTYFILDNDVVVDLSAAEIFFVIKAGADSGNNGFHTFGNSSFPTNNAHYGFAGTIYDNFGSNTRYTVGDPPGVLNDWHLYNVSAGPGQWTARFDGAELYNAGSNTVSFAGYSYIGSSPAVYFGGEIAEVIMYDQVLTPELRSLIQVYLRDKYDLY